LKHQIYQIIIKINFICLNLIFLSQKLKPINTVPKIKHEFKILNLLACLVLTIDANNSEKEITSRENDIVKSNNIISQIQKTTRFDLTENITEELQFLSKVSTNQQIYIKKLIN
jgi:hypothetical protein